MPASESLSEKFRARMAELLLPKSFLYAPERLAEVRRMLNGQKELFIDVNGVLCTTGQPITVNPDANRTLQALKDRGYYLVLWTSASKELITKIKKQGIDVSVFSLCIASEDYERVSGSAKNAFRKAVANTPWISEAAREVMLTGEDSLKTPGMLTNRFILIEDLCNTMQNQGIPPEMLINLYPYGNPSEHNFNKSPVFGHSTIELLEQSAVFS